MQKGIPPDRSTWGPWKFELKTLTLRYPSQHNYEIRLDEVDGSAEMLDWVMQLQMKTWTTAADIGYLVEAFYKLFDPQATLCGRGLIKSLMHARSSARGTEN